MHKRPELSGQGLLDSRQHSKLVNAVECLDAPVQPRKFGDGPAERLADGALGKARIKVDKVVRVHERKHVARERRIPAAGEKLHERANAPEHDTPRGKAQGLQGFDHQRDHLDIARIAALSDELEAQLRELAGRTGVARLRAHERSLVAQTKRQRGIPQAR